MLAGTIPAITDIFHSVDSSSIASWAMRFVASLDGLITMPSGMNSLEQPYDRMNTIKNFKPLTDGDRIAIDGVADTFRGTTQIPCTGRRYCIEDCPQKINIINLLAIYSDYMVYQTAVSGREMYPVFTTNRGKASDCIGEDRIREEPCPQGIGIADIMKKIAEVFE